MADQLSDIKNSLNEITSTFTSSSGAKKGKDSDEKQKYMMNQLGELNTKIVELEKTLSVGVPLAEAGEGLQRIDKLQRGLEELDSKINLYISSTKELNTKVEDLTKLFSTKVSKNQISSLSEKITYLEKLYSELSISKTNESLVSLVDVIENLRNRIKNLESVVEKEVTTYSGTDKNVINLDSGKNTTKSEEKPKGFIAKIVDGISGIFAKKK